MDESGNWGMSDSDSVFEVAGFLSTYDKWQAFANKWEELGLPRELKMASVLTKAAKGHGRDRLNSVTAMIEAAALYRIECAVHLASYRSVARGNIPKEIDDPYFFGFHASLDRICRTAIALGYSGSIDLFFDVQDRLGRNRECWYDLARILMPEEYRRMLPLSIQWKSDVEFLPLKSADLLAGLARRDHNDDVCGLEEVVARINTIPIIRGADPLDASYFQHLVNSPSVNLEREEFENWKERWRGCSQ